MPELKLPEKKDKKALDIDFDNVILKNEKVSEKFDALSSDISA